MKETGAHKKDDDRQITGNDLWKTLQEAVPAGWTGIIKVTRNEKILGSVVIKNGYIAWAVSREQNTSLGEVLSRIGLLSDEDVMEAQQEYINNKGKKKLGAILEEKGLIQRPVLRRCLLLHTRSALEELLSFENVQSQMLDKKFDADEKIVFEMDELVPREQHGQSISGQDMLWKRSPEWYAGNNTNRPLHFLKGVLGYQASAIIASDGEVIIAHCMSLETDPLLIGIYLTSILEASRRTIAPNPLANIKFMYLECADCILVSSWIDREKTHLIAVMLNLGGSVGMAKHLINGQKEELQDWLFKNRGKTGKTAALGGGKNGGA